MIQSLNLVFHGMQVEAVVGIHNNARQPLNVTGIAGSLNNAAAFMQHFQNFTYQVVSSPHKDLSVAICGKFCVRYDSTSPEQQGSPLNTLACGAWLR